MDDENLKCIEDFLMDIEILDKINTKISKFNAFESLGIVNNEIRHSNVLAWLFNPNDNHGLDDIFLKKFIQKIVYKNRRAFLNKNGKFDLISTSLMDYHDFIVRREYRNIDLLIYSEKNKFVLVIENKIRSKESEHQLNKYKKIVEDEFKDYKKVYVFLTPEGDTPSDEENWNIIDYETILEILETAVNLKYDEIGESVKYFIDQYITILRRHIVKDSELEKVCVDIYLKHKKALDLIFEYKPDIYQDITNYIKKQIIEKHRNGEEIYLDDCTRTYIRFSTKNFDERLPRDGTWTKTGRILLYEIQQKGNKLSIKLIIGPTENVELRKRIFEISEDNSTIFNKSKQKFTSQYTTIYSKDLMRKNYVERYEGNYEKITTIVKKELDNFFKGDFIKLNEVLNNL